MRARGDRNTMGPMLKALRRGAGLTQAQLAKEIGYERTSVTNVELGHQAVTDEMVNAWAKACGYIAVVKFKKVAALAPMRKRELDESTRQLQEQKAFEVHEGMRHEEDTDNWW